MITEKDYGGWSILIDGPLITAIKTITATGGADVTPLGDISSLLSLLAKYPLFLKKIEIAFDDLDVKSVIIERQLLSSPRKINLLTQTGVTTQSMILDGEQKIDVFSLYFKLIFTITYTATKKYDITVFLEEV